MSEAPKFTPGPWVVCVQDGEDEAHTIFQKSQLEDGRIDGGIWDEHICVVGIDDENWEANVELICAAPELYEACEAVVRYQKLIESGQAHGLLIPYEEICKKAEAAIVKAKGKK